MEDKRLQDLKELRALCRMKTAMWAGDRISVGDFTYGQPVVYQWDTKTRLTIGKFCSIGGNVQILMGGEHHTEWMTTYPFNVLMADAYGFEENRAKSKGDIVIGNDVWIGNSAIILSGVTIGDGAVIGAGSVVTKDVAPYQIVGGNPARHIRWRFGLTIRERLEKLAWWDWPEEKIAEAVPVLSQDDPWGLMEFDEGWSDG